MENTIPDDDLGFLLTQVSLLKQRIINQALQKIEITYMQFVILAGIYELGGYGKLVSQQTLSVRRRLDKAMVSNVVKTLLGRRLILRQRSAVDKRSFTLNLTPAGLEKALQGKQIARQIDQEFFSGICQTPFRESLQTLLLRNAPSNNE
ncbi:MAG: MarR family transcriptional regulator [Rikenellaceae bacterium]|nr:MarR family transcriptional regulator [Rikenellaceae bacterium]